ncbi:MAG: RNA methyltransferase [Armatimonadetes bacterium]|nr:RNA methyltransferase [Armatimonadota bacterium]
MIITSKENGHVKLARSLAERKGREETGFFLAEGTRLIGELLASDIPMRSLFYTEAFASRDERGLIRKAQERGGKLFCVTEAILKHLALTEHPQGIVATALARVGSCEETLIDPEAFYLILDHVSDPGNLGTILRTARGAGVTAVFLCPGTADPHNPKSVRASAGALFFLNLCRTDNPETLIKRLQSQNVCIYCGDPAGERDCFTETFPLPWALVVGSEAAGPSPSVRKLANHRLRIPQYGSGESLNVAVASGILLFVGAFRTFHKKIPSRGCKIRKDVLY